LTHTLLLVKMKSPTSIDGKNTEKARNSKVSMTLRKHAEAELLRIENEIKYNNRLIAGAPAGSLRCSKNGKHYKWFRITKEPGRTTSSYIRRSDINLARSLAVKTLCKKRVRELEEKAECLRTFIDRYAAIEKDKLPIKKVSPGFQQLLTDVHLYPDLNYELKAWLEEDYEHCPYHPEALTVSAAGNLLVRSKSEAFIASILADNGIPFRYECAIKIAGIVVYPDFTIRHPISGKLCLWEHFGLIDRPHYLNNAFDKLRLYIRGGFIPDENLILTFETTDKPLSFSFVRDLIKYHFSA